MYPSKLKDSIFTSMLSSCNDVGLCPTHSHILSIPKSGPLHPPITCFLVPMSFSFFPSNSICPAHSRQTSCRACWSGSGPTRQARTLALGSSSFPLALLKPAAPHTSGLMHFYLEPLHSRSTGTISLKIILHNTHRRITSSIHGPLSLGLGQEGCLRHWAAPKPNTRNTPCDCQDERAGEGGGIRWKEMCIKMHLWCSQCSTQDTFCGLSSTPNSKFENCYFKPASSDIKPLPPEHHKQGCTECTTSLTYFQHLPYWVKANLVAPTLWCS